MSKTVDIERDITAAIEPYNRSGKPEDLAKVVEALVNMAAAMMACSAKDGDGNLDQMTDKTVAYLRKRVQQERADWEQFNRVARGILNKER